MSNSARCVCRKAVARLLLGMYLVSIVSIAGGAPPEARVVSFETEPDHKARIENSQVRFVELLVPKGQSTLFHRHRHDVFVVFYGACTVINEPYGKKAPAARVAAGSVFYNSAANGPYVHRVIAAGNEPVHNMTLELVTPPPVGSKSVSESRFPPFELAMENSRARVYRLKLNPGETADGFTRPAGTAVMAISSGRISEMANGRPVRKIDLKPGYVSWTETGEELTIRNDSPTPIEMVEIEVF